LARVDELLDVAVRVLNLRRGDGLPLDGVEGVQLVNEDEAVRLAQRNAERVAINLKERGG
jgi:hypothetical protein